MLTAVVCICWLLSYENDAKDHANMESYGCKSHEWTRFYHTCSFIYLELGTIYIVFVVFCCFFVLFVSVSSISRHCSLVNIPYKNAEKAREICPIKYKF